MHKGGCHAGRLLGKMSRGEVTGRMSRWEVTWELGCHTGRLLGKMSRVQVTWEDVTRIGDLGGCYALRLFGTTLHREVFGKMSH